MKYKGKLIRLICDQCGDLPKRYIGRQGKIIGISSYSQCGEPMLFIVQMKNRKKPLFLYKDEIRYV